MVFGPLLILLFTWGILIRLNALTGIDGFWTQKSYRRPIAPKSGGLNALTGIDGFWTLTQ